MAGYAGLAGTVNLAEAAKEELSRWFSDEYMEEIATLRRFARKVRSSGVPAVRQNGNRQVRAAF